MILITGCQEPTIGYFPTIDNNDLSWKMEPWMGMVRVSLGLYNTREDLDFFSNSLNDIVKKKDWYKKQYKIDELGNYIHREFKFTGDQYFNMPSIIDEELNR